jgi:hypothetical protein
MPNWCNNSVKITGPQEDIDTFLNDVLALGGEGVSQENGHHSFRPDKDILSGFFPLDPSAYKEVEFANGTTMTAFADNGAEMAYDLWGSKWPDCESNLSWVEGEASVSWGFQTAWSPTGAGTRLLSEKYPTLKFVHGYFEGGMGYMGSALFYDGSQRAEIYYEEVCDWEFPAMERLMEAMAVLA